MIRLFQFKNNFLRENDSQLEAEYSTIGYFDGLDMQVFDENTDKGLEILSDTYQNLLYAGSSDKMLEACDYFNVAGMCRNNQRDSDFWRDLSKKLIFVSFLRFTKRTRKLKLFIEMIEKDSDCICYTTYDSSDLIICIRANRYSHYYDVLNRFYDMIETDDYDKNHLQKCFSVFAIKQTTLNDISDNCDWLQDEKVDCFFRGVVNERREVDQFYHELVRECGVLQHEIYWILGSDDVIIAIYDISLAHLLSLYGDGAILVHSNDVYKKAFYNIRSEIAIKK